MEEPGRCGRRKQRNPRRNNDEDGGDTTEGTTGGSTCQEPIITNGESCHDNKENTAEAPSDRMSTQESSPEKQTSICTDSVETDSQEDIPKENLPTENLPADNITKDVKFAKINDVSGSSSKENSPIDTSITNLSKDADKAGSVFHYYNERMYEPHCTEVDQIAALLNRSDTAVIFPEPVSDDETNNNNSNNNNNNSDRNNNNELDLDSVDPDYMLKCMHCGIGFERVFMLREHIQEAHNESVDKHICAKCGADFLLKSQLDKHLLLHSPAAQVCKICSKTFANVYRLQRHLISHDESTDLRKFKCPECGKAFKFKHHLKEHIRIHSGEKPFACGNCGKRFSHSGSYSSHMTSKKCWVVNPKMRKPEENGGLNSPEREEPLRPLVPKAHENAGDMRLAQLYGQQFPQQFIPFDPTGGHLSAQYLALNGSRPFLPYAFAAGHVINPLLLPPSAYMQHVLNRSQEKLGEQNSAEKPTDSSKPQEHSLNDKVATDQEQSKLDISLTEEKEDNTSSLHVKHDENQNEQSVINSTEEKQQLTVKSELPGDSDAVSMDANGEVKTPDMVAVQKVLDMVSATISQQQMVKEDKVTISKLTTSEEKEECGSAMLPCRYCKEPCSSAIELHQHESYLCKQRKDSQDLEDNSGVTSGDNGLTCRHCHSQFTSPVELHQHERYLCQHNADIQADGRPVNHSPGAEKERCETMEEDTMSETSQAEKEGRQYHVRSWFSEEQRQTLKGHYRNNPRPDKHELTSIATQLGLPKRVVQVWFQNTRAQDRRKGIAIPPVSASKQPLTVSPQSVPSEKPSPAYIPVVPVVPFNGLHSPSSSLTYYANNKPTSQVPTSTYSTAKPASSTTYGVQAEPLDLSVRRPTEAHSSKLYSSPGQEVEEGEVLNLSQKSCKDNDKCAESNGASEMNGEEEKSCCPSKPGTPNLPHSRTPTPVMSGTPAPIARCTPDHVPPMSPRHSPLHSILPPSMLLGAPLMQRCSPSLLRTSPSLLCSSPGMQRASPLLQQPLVPPGSPLSIITSPPHSLESSFNSSMSHDSMGFNGDMAAKRARRKSWRQLESDEMDLDESLMIDEDSPNRKRRRSWKQHLEEGQYACDQCDKLFSKQSSLARHKYEHSGARPFNCADCGKAFKHKHHLTEHRRLHSGEKPFICAKCGKRFSHSGSYSQHMNHRYKYCKPLAGEAMEATDSS